MYGCYSAIKLGKVQLGNRIGLTCIQKLKTQINTAQNVPTERQNNKPLVLPTRCPYGT